MIDEHVHCSECGRSITTHIKVARGKTKEREDIRAIQAPKAVRTPQGVGYVAVQVPVCDICADAIDAAAQRARATSKLIVPGLQSLPGGQPL